MARKMFVNLPVKDLARSKAFFGALGFEFNPQFSDDTAACMVIGEDNFAMLLTRDKFTTFTSKQICDTATTTEVLIALSCDSREEVDTIGDKILELGGTPNGEPKDYGFMYYRSLHDLDGHCWEFAWMDMAAMEQGPGADATVT